MSSAPRTRRSSTSRRDVEAPIHAAIYQYITTVAPQVICFHPANGGLRSKAEAAKLKWMGVTPGVPDLVILDEFGMSYLIEVKPPDGNLSDDQRMFHAKCKRLQIPHAVARSINDARDLLKRWGIATREAK